jgi:hypothetical protein
MSVAYTRPQPLTRAFLIMGRAWTINNVMTDGVGANTAALVNTTSTPRFSQNAGVGAANETAAATTNVYHVVISVLSGASSRLIVDGAVVSGGNPGAATSGGLTIMADGAFANFAAMQIKEIIELSRDISAAEAALITNYLAAKGGLGFTV